MSRVRTTGRRPGVSPGSDEAATTYLSPLRCTESFKADVQRAAAEAGMNAAEWRRQALRQALGNGDET